MGKILIEPRLLKKWAGTIALDSTKSPALFCTIKVNDDHACPLYIFRFVKWCTSHLNYFYEVCIVFLELYRLLSPSTFTV